MDATIVIPTKNAGKDFEKVLEKVFSQKTKYSYEVICVDSGSKDETLSIIKKFPAKIYKISPSEFGHGKTRNFGASKGTGEYIIFLTQDALPYDNNWIEEFIDAMKLDNKIAGAFGKHVPYPDCNILDKFDLTNHFNNFGKQNTIYEIDDEKKYKEEESYMHFLCFFSDNNSCIRRSVFEKYPYEDVEFAEDQIWMRKMLELGFKKVYVPKAIVYHSHNFPIKTYYKRYYDEHKGLYEVFKYRISEKYFILYLYWLRHVKNDIINIIRPAEISKFAKFKWVIYSLRRNWARYFGGYKGGMWHTYSVKKKIKMDKRYSQQYKQRNT